MVKGKQKAGAALGNGKQTICTSTLPERTITQRAELIALTEALQLAKEKNKNIYTDSRYVFTTTHICGTIYRERGLLTSAGKDINNNNKKFELIRSQNLKVNLKNKQTKKKNKQTKQKQTKKPTTTIKPNKQTNKRNTQSAYGTH